MRTGQTEAAVDLARMAGFEPGGVICEIMNPGWDPWPGVPELTEFCHRHGLKMISVAGADPPSPGDRAPDRAARRGMSANGVRLVQDDFLREHDRLIRPHVALVHGNPGGRENVLVRMHARCIYGDVFGSTQCSCQQMIRSSLARIAEEPAGVFVYLHQSGLAPRTHYSAGEGHAPTA